MMTIDRAFEIIDIFKDLDRSIVEYIKPFSSLKLYNEKEHIFIDKDEVHHCYFIVSGKVSLYKLNNFGDKKIIFILDSGKMINEHSINNLKISINCEVIEDSIIMSIPSNILLKAMEQNFKLNISILNLMSFSIKRLYRQLQNTTSNLECEKKIIAKLLKLSRDNGIYCGNMVKINIPLSIKYISEMIGVRRETISRQINKLIKINLIEFRDHYIFVKDIRKLRKYFNRE